jgi:hypothetical protein
MARRTGSSASTADSIEAWSASRATVTSARLRPLTWTGRVTAFSTSNPRSTCGQGASATNPLPPSACQHSSARCGIIGARSRTKISAASRKAKPRSPALPFAFASARRLWRALESS